MSMATRRSGAFTLIELLVVIGIIGILIALAFAVGHHVSGSGKAHATESTIKALEGSLAVYIAEKGSMPPATVLDPRPDGSSPNDQYVWPVADARNMTGSNQEIINSAGLFILQGKGLAEFEAAIRGVDQKFMRTYDPDAGNANDWFSQPELITAFDGWGNPIRYVHPMFHGIVADNSSEPPAPTPTATLLGNPSPRQFSATSLRRATGGAGYAADADGGMCVGGRPYFYSCGPDGKVGYEFDSSGAVLNDFNADNIYLVKPQVQKTN